jgi:2'-5' RNA ligase
MAEKQLKIKHPHRYGLLFMVSKEDYNHLNKYKLKLDPYVKFYMKEECFNDIAPQHISLCYFSYPEKYPKEVIKKLVPKINRIAKKFIPMKIKVKGLLGGWELGWGFPVIMWNIVDFGKINEFHKKLITSLKKDVEHFNDVDLDFEPHIGIALGNDEFLPKLKEIVENSKSDSEFELILDKLSIFFPEGIEEI